MREAGFNERAAEAAHREADEATARFFRDFAATVRAAAEAFGRGAAETAS